MVNRFGPGSVVANNHVVGERQEQAAVGLCPLPALFVPTIQMVELHLQEPGLNGIESAVVAFYLVVILSRLPMIAQHANAASNRFVICGCCAGFTAGA